MEIGNGTKWIAAVCVLIPSGEIAVFTQVRSPMSGCGAQQELPADGQAADLGRCVNDGVFVRSVLGSFPKGLSVADILCVEFTLTLADVVRSTSKEHSQVTGLHNIGAQLERGCTVIDM